MGRSYTSEEWLNAELCLFYKQKGKIDDPNSYRGISLLSSAEKIISLVILGRIKPHLDRHLNLRQAGFRTGKSCRNAVFILLRDLEESILNDKPLIFNFVDFKKAFDSLDWETMWKVMEAQGMPMKIIGIIKELYNNATVSVRLNTEGKMAPKFRQKVGIRQGCSLSPALFVLVLDFAMNAYMESCEELGIDADATWLGYADDLAIKSSGTNAAQAAFHQLQATCAFVGLHCNIDKTECMARGISKPTTVLEDSCKERMQVTFDDGKFEGWLVDWAGRKHLAPVTDIDKLDITRLQPSPSHLILFDSSDPETADISAIQMGKNGWLTDQDGDKHRCKLLGSKEFLNQKKNSIRCTNCKAVFRSDRALKSHNSKKCRNREDMTVEEQAKLRRKRETNANIAGRNSLRVEKIKIEDVSGDELKSVAQFKYLGTTVTTDGRSTKEINKRIGEAASVVASLSRIWASTGIPLLLKSRLYKALVMTIALYNGECWLLRKQDIKTLEGFHFRSLRRLTRKKRRRDLGSMDIDKASRKEVFNTAEIPTIEELLREKRLRWFGHLMRENENDPARKTLMREKATNSKWYQQLTNDFKTRKLNVKEAEAKALDKVVWRRISYARLACDVRDASTVK